MTESGKDSRAARKREVILEAATTAFLSKGYLGTSMDDVASLAAASKQTVYKHFVDKEQLFSRVIGATTEQIEEIVRVVTDDVAHQDDLESYLHLLASRLLAALTQPRLLQLRRLVIANVEQFPDVGRLWYEQGFERILETLATTFERLADRGLLELDDPMLAANQFAGMLLWTPVNRAMFAAVKPNVIESENERYAASTVRAFLATYRRL